MKTLVLTASMLMTGMIPIMAVAQTQHAHIASPEHYSVLLENENVLVLKMTLKPGQRDNIHRHNAETVYFEKGGKAEISTDGKIMPLDIPDGYVMWHDAWVHQVSNVGDTTITAIIVEQKNASEQESFRK